MSPRKITTQRKNTAQTHTVIKTPVRKFFMKYPTTPPPKITDLDTYQAISVTGV